MRNVWTRVATAALLAAACRPADTLPPRPTSTATTSAMQQVASSPAVEFVDPVAIGMTVDGVVRLCDDHLAVAERLLASLRALDVTRLDSLTFERTLGVFDDVSLAIDDASAFPHLMSETHPDTAVREAAKQCEVKTDKLTTAMYLDAAVYRALEAYAERREPLAGERARFLRETLRDFRRNGIELEAAPQSRLRAINEEITALGQAFSAEIGGSRGEIRVKPSSLAGLAPDYVAKHPPGADGLVGISTDYPDYFPFVTYARDRQAALDLYVSFVNRGGSANIARLDRLLALRREKARLLGYATWADYAIEPRMARTPVEARAFLERVRDAVREPAKAEFAEFQAAWHALGGKANAALFPPDRYYLEDRVRDAKFALDSQRLAEYFDVEAVTRGLLDVAAHMYGLEFRPVDEVLWDPAVRGYEVWSGGSAIGKIYLDLQPRPNKYKHAAKFTVRTRKRLQNGELQTPIAALVCNFPPPGDDMQHSDVVTFFHEFGHVLHHIFSETELATYSGTATVRDFVEAPSQMFEEWAWSREVLDRFARRRGTGEKIPDELYDAMTRARRLGRALATQRQLTLAWLDLAYHAGAPPLDTTASFARIQGETELFAYVPGTHFQSSFGHLIGYDAGYYGYQWALSLARDVLGRFTAEGLLNPKTAADWRIHVLSRGGADDEREMLERFLGRRTDERAYAAFLAGT